MRRRCPWSARTRPRCHRIVGMSGTIFSQVRASVTRSCSLRFPTLWVGTPLEHLVIHIRADDVKTGHTGKPPSAGGGSLHRLPGGIPPPPVLVFSLKSASEGDPLFGDAARRRQPPLQSCLCWCSPVFADPWVVGTRHLRLAGTTLLTPQVAYGFRSATSSPCR